MALSGNSRSIIFGLITAVAVTGLIVAIVYYETRKNKYQIRVDCQPEIEQDYYKCSPRGCTWFDSESKEIPSCFFPKGYGYKMVGQPKYTDYGSLVNLTRTTDDTLFGNDIENITLQVFTESNRLRIKIFDPANPRYEVPVDLPKFLPNQSPKDYTVDFVNKPQFGIQITRTSTSTKIFDTNVPGMIFSNQFLQLTTILPTSNIYGLGEHLTEEYRHNTSWQKWSFFARDQPLTERINEYGVHPFYMNVEENGNAHGVFMLNSNAMEYVLQPYPALTFRTIGGIFDFYIFLGPSPEDVVKQYQQLIGFPMMPAYWSLGFQLSRWGYVNLSVVEDVVERNEKAQLPQEIQVLDIDYMDGHRDFTYDKETFKEFPEFIDRLHSKNKKLILILDPAIQADIKNYTALDDGIEMDVFIKINGKILEGKVWPGLTYYPDFTHPNATEYWSKQCANLHEDLKFDGLWIDMNEPSSFVPGSTNSCPNGSLDIPPYAAGVLGSSKGNQLLYDKTICMSADQAAGKHYDVHSLYGYFQSKSTFNALLNIAPAKRPMVLSRSTYPGSGKYAAHWLGDNTSIWSHLRYSIPGILEFSLFGYPLVGADICGFFGDTTDELCLRWMQLGSFYPFCRNHNGFGQRDQDPASLGEKVLNASRHALLTRYSLLPYLYTLFHYAHVDGSTVARPLLHEFPSDEKTWDISFQFLWGPALLISPIVNEGDESVKAYFPKDLWYDFYTGVLLKSGNGNTVTLPDLGQINLHVRGGYILPLQEPSITTKESRENPMGLFIAPDANGNAKGSLFWDDGETYKTFENNQYQLLNFSLNKENSISTLTIQAEANFYKDPSNLNIEDVKLCGLNKKPSKIDLNGVELKNNWQYDQESKVLTLNKLNMRISEKSVISIEES